MAGEGRVSLLAFLVGLSVVLLPPLTVSVCPAEESRSLRSCLALALALHMATVNGLLLLLYRAQLYQIAVRACWLGFAFGCGLLLSFTQSAWKHFGWYVCSLSLFHYSEYLITAVNNPKSLSLDSFLLNHSWEYTLAAVSSWMEFTIEKFIYPGFALQPCLCACLHPGILAIFS